MFSFQQEKTVFETVTKWQKENAGRISRRWPPRPASFLFRIGKRHRKLRFLKCCIGHIMQLLDCLPGKLAHICVHIGQGVGNRRHCTAAVIVVIHTDQIFFLHGKRNAIHIQTSKSCSFVLAAAFFGAAAFICPALSCERTEGRGLRRGRSRFSSLLMVIACIQFFPAGVHMGKYGGKIRSLFRRQIFAVFQHIRCGAFLLREIAMQTHTISDIDRALCVTAHLPFCAIYLERALSAISNVG